MEQNTDNDSSETLDNSADSSGYSPETVGYESMAPTIFRRHAVGRVANVYRSHKGLVVALSAAALLFLSYGGWALVSELRHNPDTAAGTSSNVNGQKSIVVIPGTDQILTVNPKLQVQNDTVIKGDLAVDGSTVLHKLTVDGNVAVTGNGTFGGDVTANNVVAKNLSGNFIGSYNGNGSGLNGLDASNITSGTLSDARLSPDVTVQGNTFNGANELVRLDANGALPAASGTYLTDVNALTLNGQAIGYFTNAANIASGTLSDARLSTNVALRDAANSFTNTNTFASAINVQGTVNGQSAIFANGVSALTFTQNGNVVCDASGNCGGGGGGVAGSGTINTIALFTNVGVIGNSLITQSGSTVTVAGTMSATDFQGSGSGLTSLNASNVASGTLADGRLSTNVPLLTAVTNTFTGTISATALTGNGAGVTGVNAAQLNGQVGSYYTSATNLSTGTLADGRLSTNVTLAGNTFNGPSQLVQLTAGGLLPLLNGSNISSVNASALQGFTASYFTDATNLSSGTVADARLSGNVALRNASNTFTGATNTFNGVVATGITQNGNTVCDVSGNCAGIGGGVTTAGGTTGTLALFSAGQQIANSILTQASTTVTVAGTLVATALQGSGSAITNLNASNVSSGSLAVNFGGTGANTFAANGVIYGNGTGALQATTAGVTGECLVGNTAAAPAWVSCASAGSGSTPGGAAGGDLSGTYPNPTVAKLQGTALSVASLASGDFLLYNGTNWVNHNLTGDITVTGGGVVTIGAGTVTNAKLVNSSLTVTAGPGLSGGGSVSLGGSTTVSVAYGSVASTAVQGNTTLTCASGTGNLAGGGGTITLGTGGTCGNLNTVASPTFTSITLLSPLDITSGGTGAITAGAARTNLGAAASGTNSDITSLSGLTTALTVGQGGTGANTAAGARTNLGAAASGANSDITSLINTASIGNSAGALTVGNTNQALTLQGNASSVFAATTGGFTTSVGFASPTANASYVFQAAPAGTYNICTTAGNCVGSGGGVTTVGGTAGTIPVFTGSQTLGDSLLSQAAGTVTVGGILAVNSIAPTAALLLGVTAQNVTVQGAAVAISSTSGANTNTLNFATPSGSSHSITLPNANGTVAVSASGTLSLDANGNISCVTCTTSGGGAGGAVDSLNSMNGSLTLQGTANQIIVNSAAGIITLSTPQDINTSSSPTFSNLTLTGTLGVTGTITGGNLATGGTLAVTGAATAASFNGLSLAATATGFTVTGGTAVKTVTVTSNVTLDQNLSTTSSPSFAGLTLGTALSVANGGTGSTTAPGARTNLGAAASGANADITSLSGLTTALTLGQGGTGSTTSGGARTNLGAAASGANSDITSLTGLTTALSVTQGGSGAATFTSNGVLYGNGAGALQATAAGITGQCLVGNTAAAPTWTSCTGAASGATPGGAAGGDLAGTYPNPTIAKLQGSTLTLVALASGDLLQYNGSAFVNGHITNANLTAGSFGAITGVGTLGSLTVSGATILQGGATLGIASSSTGTLTLANSTSSFTGGLSVASLTQNTTYTLPVSTAATDTICLQTLANCSGAGASAVGALDGGTANATGGTIASNTLYLQSASTSFAGLVNTGTQSFAGAKTFTGTAIFNSTVTVAASQSISLVGGITSSRPASPTVGMLYFDSSTNQLIQWNGTKWVSDHSTSTKIVAASNSTQANKDAADYIATGTGDQATINTALTAASGGLVYLMEGTYNVAAPINVSSNTTLAGAGGGTLITVPNTQNLTYDVIASFGTTHIVVRDLQIDGNKTNNATATMNGIKLVNVGSGAGSTAVDGAKITNVIVRNIAGASNDGYGISLNNSKNNAITEDTLAGNNVGIGLTNNSGNNIVSNNNTQGSTTYGIFVFVAKGNVITSNTAEGNSIGIYLLTAAINNTITGNTANGNTSAGITLQFATNNTITGNNTQGNTNYGIWLFSSGANNNTITGNNTQSNGSGGINVNGGISNTIGSNKVDDNGGATANNGIIVSDSQNTITGNDITDTSCTTTCFAINITAGNNNYLADNRFSATAATPTINDAGTGTIYANQSLAANGGQLLTRTANDALAFQVQNAAGNTVLAVDTTAGAIQLGKASALTGQLTFKNAANTGAITLQGAATAGNFTITLPAETGTVCTTASVCAGYASSAGAFIQNQNASQQAASNFWISGTARADTSVLTPLVDTASAVALNIGTTNATAINLNQNTTLASGKTLTVQGLSTFQVAGYTANAFTFNNGVTGATPTIPNAYAPTLVVRSSQTSGSRPLFFGYDNGAGTGWASYLNAGACGSFNQMCLNLGLGADDYTALENSGTTLNIGGGADGNFTDVNFGNTGSLNTGSGAINLNGNTKVSGTLQAPSLDTATAVALNLGSANATNINLNQNTTLVAGKTFTSLGLATFQNWVGIGNYSPAAPLDVTGSAPGYFNNFESGVMTPLTTDDATIWQVLNNTSYSGSYSAVGSNPSNIQGPTYHLNLTKTLTAPGNISFYYNCSWTWSSAFTFQIDGGTLNDLGNCTGLSTNNTWTLSTFGVSAGTHTFTWGLRSAGGAAGSLLQLKVDNIMVTNVGIVTGPAAVFNGNVGVGLGSGIMPNYALDVLGGTHIQALTDNTSNFSLQNASGLTTLFNADTTNSKLSVNQSNFVINNFGTPATPVVTAGSNQGGTFSGAAGTTYYYKVAAVNGAGESVSSGEASFASGSFTPLTAPGVATLATAAGTNLGIGAYKYEVTFVTANGETTGGTEATITTTASNQAVALSAIPLGPTGTTQRKLYRTVVGGGTGSELLLTTLADNTTTTYADSTVDGSLGAALPGSNTARTNLNNATVTFTPVTGATSYKVYRGTSAGAENVYQTTAASPFTDSGAAGTAGSVAASDGTGRLGVGTTTPNFSIDAVGSINASVDLRVGGVVICTSAGCTPTGGAGVTLQGSTPGTQQTGNFNISGTGIAATFTASTSLLAPLVDTASAVALNIGTANATAINLNQNTTIAANKSLLAQGASTFQNATNSLTAFAVKDSSGSAALSVDTTNRWVGIGNAAPTATLDVVASTPAYFNNFESGLLSPFTTSGGVTAQWSVTTSASPVPYNGSYVAKVYAPNSTNSVANLILTKTLTGAGTVSFYYQCTSYWSGFTFQIDGGVKNAMPGCGGWGTSGWLYASYGVAAGTHTFTWSFDGVQTGGNPSMSIDNVNITNVGSGTAAIFNGGGVGIGLGAGNSPAHTLDVQGDAQFKSLIDSTTALQIQNAAGNQVISVDTTAGVVTMGTASALTGQLSFANSGNASAVTLQAGASSAAYALTLPTAAPTTGQCLQSGAVTAGLMVFGSCGAATTIGSLDGGTANANGATYSSNALYLQSAGASFAGLVNTTTQTFAGAKTFSGQLSVGGPSVHYLRNLVVTGALSFSPKVDYTMSTVTGPRIVTNADFNGDGKPDLAVANNDGSNTVSVFIGNSDGTFAAKVDYTTGTSPYSVTAADFNGDGKPDLAATNFTANTVSVFINNGNGTFAAKVDYTAGTNPFSVTAADFNGDGKPDLAVANETSPTVSVFMNTGTGTFAAKVDYTTGTNPQDVTAADFNGDGKIDLAVTNYTSSTISVFMNTGTGTFAAKVDYTTGTNPRSVTAADFNGDGKLDLAVTNDGSSTISVFMNTGTGTFAAKVDYTTGTNPYSVTAADFNGDGKPDLAVTNYTSLTVSVFINLTVMAAPAENSYGQLSVTTAAAGNGGLFIQGVTGQTARLLVIQDGSGNSLLSVDPIGNLKAKGTITGGVSAPDYAENITASDRSIGAADVVALDPFHPGAVVKSAKPYDPGALGVISTHPGFVTNGLMDGADDSSQRPLALSGRVPVKVVNENGAITAGDYLTSSSTPGAAMKATLAGPVIGRALEAFDGSSGTILLFIDNTYYNPNDANHLQSNDIATTTLQVSGLTSLTDLNVSGAATITNLTVTGPATFKGDVTVMGSITTQNITVNGHIITGGSAPTIAAGAAACAAPTVNVRGNDTSGTVSITTGTGCAVTSPLATITFNAAYGKTPQVMLSPRNNNASDLKLYNGAASTTSFTIDANVVPTGGTTYLINYWVVE